MGLEKLTKLALPALAALSMSGCEQQPQEDIALLPCNELATRIAAVTANRCIGNLDSNASCSYYKGLALERLNLVSRAKNCPLYTQTVDTQ